MTPAKIVSAILRPLITTRPTTNPLASIFGGRKYSSISSSKSEEELLYALEQPSLTTKIERLEIAVLCGANINMALKRLNNKSLLEYICGSSPYLFEKDLVPLTKTLFSLGARINYRNFQEGSPLHNVLFFTGSLENKLGAIEVLSKEMSVNHLNQENATPLDYAHFFCSNEEGRKAIVSALCERGAIHGFGAYSPPSLLKEIPLPLAQLVFQFLNNAI